MKTLVEVAGLQKHYAIRSDRFLGPKIGPLRAVDGIDLSIREGETLGLVGESGCGKSTLGRMLIRLVEPTGGRIVFDGHEITGLSGGALREQRRAMQIVFQDPYGALNPRMSVEDIVLEPLLIHRLHPIAEARRIVADTLRLVGLPQSALAKYPHEFSGGQRQRIGIARALVARPKFIVCDEAVSALDVSVQAQIINLLQDLQAELGLTYLFIAHDLSVVKHISDRVAVMYLGKIVEIAEKDVLYKNPLHPYTQALIASVPILQPRDRGRGRRNRLTGEIPSALNPPSGCRFHPRCPFALDICRETEPKLSGLASGTEVACHLHQ